MGVSSGDASEWAGNPGHPEKFEIWPENWPILQVFLALSTQWHWTGGMEPRRAGLYYPSLECVYDGLEIDRKKRAEIFRGVQVMEYAALTSMN